MRPRVATFIGCMAIIIALCVITHKGAHAHDYWKTGEPVVKSTHDPVTHNVCCSNNDTKELDSSLVGEVTGGFYLRDTHEFIAMERVLPSNDSSYYASRWGGETKCFFAPMSF